MTPTPGDLARRALELLEGVTEGPYQEYPDDQNDQAVIGGAHFEIATFWHHCVGSIEKEMRANAAFVLWAFENAPALAAENTALREALHSLLPGPLCGEAWGLPDTEKVAITVTFGAIRKARALSPTSPHGGDDAK
jgi:hypothetical protein